MKREDFFDNLNVLFSNTEENDEYIYTKAIVYRNLDTGEIDSVQIINSEYKEFMVINKKGDIDFVNMDEAEQLALLGDKSGKKKK